MQQPAAAADVAAVAAAADQEQQQQQQQLQDAGTKAQVRCWLQCAGRALGALGGGRLVLRCRSLPLTIWLAAAQDAAEKKKKGLAQRLRDTKAEMRVRC